MNKLVRYDRRKRKEEEGKEGWWMGRMEWIKLGLGLGVRVRIDPLWALPDAYGMDGERKEEY
jgi:hypothetical protein